MNIGAGWTIHHLTDRVVELRKDSYEYRRFTGRDGFVVARAEPGMDRQHVVARAIKAAKMSDEALALRIAERMVPSMKALADYTGKRVRLEQSVATKEDVNVIGVKRA